jgi:hypothetical protein
MLKKFLFLLFVQFVSNVTVLAEPSGRGYDPDAPDIGLPGGNEVFTGLIIAIIAIPLGYAILNAGKREKSSDESLFPGCLGMLFIGGGIVCLLPLVAWLCSILSVIFVIGFIAFIVIGIIAFLFSKNK